MANEAGKIVMLEVIRKKITGEFRRPPNDEGGVVFAPRDDMIGGRIVDELVRLGEKWRRH